MSCVSRLIAILLLVTAGCAPALPLPKIVSDQQEMILSQTRLASAAQQEQQASCPKVADEWRSMPTASEQAYLNSRQIHDRAVGLESIARRPSEYQNWLVSTQFRRTPDSISTTMSDDDVLISIVNTFAKARIRHLQRQFNVQNPEAFKAFVEPSSLSNAAFRRHAERNSQFFILSANSLRNGVDEQYAEWYKVYIYYINRFVTGKFSYRSGERIVRPSISGTTIPDDVFIAAEAVLLEFLADFILGTPVYYFDIPNSTERERVWYPGWFSETVENRNRAPTATTTPRADWVPIRPMTQKEDFSCRGMTPARSRVVQLLSDMTGSGATQLSGAIAESVSSANLGVAFAGVNFSIGDGTTVQHTIKTVFEVVSRRAMEYTLTSIFEQHAPADMPYLVQFVLKVLTEDPISPPTGRLR